MSSLGRLGYQLHTGERSFSVVPRRRTWLTIAAVLVLLTVLIVLFRGVNAGIEFRGGSQFTVTGVPAPEQQIAHDVVAEVGDGEVARVSTVGASAPI